LNPKPEIRNPSPKTLDLAANPRALSQTLNPKPSTPNPQPEFLNPKPVTAQTAWIGNDMTSASPTLDCNTECNTSSPPNTTLPSPHDNATSPRTEAEVHVPPSRIRWHDRINNKEQVHVPEPNPKP
jgi:hypothetical protein